MGWFLNWGKSQVSREGLKKAFSSIKLEFEEHLDAINENTNEMQSNYELLLRLEGRLEKIESKILEVDRFIKQFKSQHVYFLDEDANDTFTVMPLTDEEKRVFKTIYEFEEHGIRTSYQKLASALGISASLVREYTSFLIEKGIPIIKHYHDQAVYLSLEPKFKGQQTRKNVVGI